jgi:hypothetical protein
VDLLVPERNGDALEPHLLHVRVHPHRHCGASAKAGEQPIVGRRLAVHAADALRFVGNEPLRANREACLTRPMGFS